MGGRCGEGGRGWKKESVNNGAGEVVGWEKQKTRVRNKDGWKQCDSQGGDSRSQAKRQELRLCKKNAQKKKEREHSRI